MIICCGEALIDMLPRKMTDGNDAFLPVAGGALFNTAIALGRLGVETGFLSSISHDMFGNQLMKSLQKSKVDTTYCVRLDNPTTLAFVRLNNGEAEYSFFDENSALRNLTASALPKLPESVCAIHFGGISLIPEPCGHAYEVFMQQNQDVTISLDPNIRPNLIQDHDAHRRRIERMIAISDIVKVSDTDLDWIANGKSEKGIIETWLEDKTRIVILTKGEKGAWAYTKEGVIHQPISSTIVEDTIGAGDAFNAGLLAKLYEHRLLSKNLLKSLNTDQLKPALAYAAEVSAYTVSKAGATPPWKSELVSNSTKTTA